MTENFASLAVFLASLKNISTESQHWTWSPTWQLLAEAEWEPPPLTRKHNSSGCRPHHSPLPYPWPSSTICHLQVCPTWSTLVWDHLVQTKIKLLKKKKHKTVIVNQKVLTVRNVVAKGKLTASKTKHCFLIPHTCLLDSLEPLPRVWEQKLYCLRYHFYSCQQRIRLHSDEG